MTTRGESPIDPPWTLPKLRIDVDGNWYDDDVEITHHGVLANLRGNLRRDSEGYFIQTRVRIPVAVADAPWVVTRVERRGEGLHAILNDGSETLIDPATFQLLALGEYDELTDQSTLRLGARRFELTAPRPST